MSYTDLRDFHPEHETTIDDITYSIEKLGGGIIGESYTGTWRYIVTAPDGTEIARGQDLWTGTAKNHDEVAIILREFLFAEILDSDELADILAMPDTEEEEI